MKQFPSLRVAVAETGSMRAARWSELLEIAGVQAVGLQGGEAANSPLDYAMTLGGDDPVPTPDWHVLIAGLEWHREDWDPLGPNQWDPVGYMILKKLQERDLAFPLGEVADRPGGTVPAVTLGYGMAEGTRFCPEYAALTEAYSVPPFGRSIENDLEFAFEAASRVLAINAGAAQ